MAEEQVIISVDLQAGDIEKRLSGISNEMARVKFEQQQLNEQTKKGVPVTGEFLKQQAALKQEMQELTRQQKNLTAAVATSNKTTKDYSDSLDGMRAQLKDMQASYATLTKAQRESAEGKEFLKSIVEQDKAVKGLEKSIGNARMNVGNYEGAIKSAFPAIGKFSDGIEKVTGLMESLGTGGVQAMKGLVAGLGQATKAALKFIATPIGAAITAIVAAVALLTAGFKKLQEAFKKNDEAGTAMAKLFASFEPIVDAISRAFDKLASALGKVAEKFANWLGDTNDAIKAAQNLVVANDKLEETERKYTENSAKRNRDIAELRAKATQTEQYSAEERIEMLKQAMELEKQNLEDQKNIAAERLRILEETAKKESDTSDETANKISQARAALYQAEEQYYSGTRRLLAQLNAAEKEIAAEREARKDTALEDIFLIYDEETRRVKLLNDGLQALANVEEERDRIRLEAEKELNKLRKDAESYVEEEEEVDVPSVEDIVRQKFGIDKEAIAYFNELMGSGMSVLEAFDKMQEYVAKRGAEDFAKMAGSLSKSFNDIAGLLNEYGENSEEAAKASKAFALAGIIAGQAQSIANTALSVSEAVAGATAAAAAKGPAAPFMLGVYIASMVGTVLAQLLSTASAFIEAKQLLSGADAGAFSDGGVVGGTSYTGDKLTARVNSDEVILNPKQASNVLYQMANSPIGVGFDYEAMAAAVAALPAPVVVYKEFQDFGDRVATYNEIAKV